MIPSPDLDLIEFLNQHPNIDRVFLYEDKEWHVFNREDRPGLESLRSLVALESKKAYWVHASSIFNVRISGERNAVTVTYDTASLGNSTNTPIRLEYSLDGGRTWNVSRNLSGNLNAVPDAANLQLTWNSHLDFQTNALNLRVRLAADLPDGETPDSFAPVVLLKNDPDSFQIEEAVASAQQQSAAGLASSYHVAKTLKDAASTQEEVRLQAHLIYAVTNLVNHFQDNTDPARTLTKLLDKVNLFPVGRDIFNFTAEFVIDLVTKKITLGDFQGIYEIQEYFANPIDGTLKAIKDSLDSLNYVQNQIRDSADDSLVLNLNWDGQDVAIQKKDIHLVKAVFHFLSFVLQYFSSHQFDLSDQSIKEVLDRRFASNTVSTLKGLVERYSDETIPDSELQSLENIEVVEILRTDDQFLKLRDLSLLTASRDSLGLALESSLHFIKTIEALSGGSPISAFYVTAEDMHALKENKKVLLSIWNNLNQSYHPDFSISGLTGDAWYSVSASLGETLIHEYDSTISRFSGFDLGYVYGYDKGIGYRQDPNSLQLSYFEYDRLSFIRVNLLKFLSKSFRAILLDEGELDPNRLQFDEDLIDAQVERHLSGGLIREILPDSIMKRSVGDPSKLLVFPSQLSVMRGPLETVTISIPFSSYKLKKYNSSNTTLLSEIWDPNEFRILVDGPYKTAWEIPAPDELFEGEISLSMVSGANSWFQVSFLRTLDQGNEWYRCFQWTWPQNTCEEWVWGFNDFLEYHASGISAVPKLNDVKNFPPTIQIGNGANLSLSRQQKPASALSRITTADSPTYKIYSLDGELLEGPTSIAVFPITIELTGVKNLKARGHGVLVACLDSAGKNYRNIFSLSSADLSSKGPILDNGAIRIEDVDGSSTVVTALIESELTNQIGLPIRTCEQLSGAVKTVVDDVVQISNSIRGIAVDELAKAVKEAANTPGSLVNEIVVLASANTSSSTQINPFVRTARNASGILVANAAAKLSRARNLMRAATGLSRQIRSSASTGTISQQRLLDYLRALLVSTDAISVINTAGGEAIASALEISRSHAASSLTTLNIAINNTVGSLLTNTANLGTAAQTISNDILDDVASGEAAALDSGNEVDSLGAMIGAALAGTAAGSEAAVRAEEALQFALAAATEGESLLGEALEAATGSTSSVQKVVNIGKAANIDISHAVKQAGVGHKLTAAQAVTASFTDIVIQNSVTIVGPTGAQPGSYVILAVDGVETQSGSYTYEWALGGAGTVISSSNDSITFIADTPNTYTITLTQKLDGATQSADTHSLTVRTADAPEIVMTETDITIRQGGAGFLTYLAAAASANAPTSTIVVGSGTGCASAVTGLTASVTGGRIDIAATSAVTASPAYCAIVTAIPAAGGNSASKQISIEVLGVLPTTVSVLPITDQNEGNSVTINANAFHDLLTHGTFELMVSGPESTVITGALNLRSTQLNITLADLKPGDYTVTATATTLEDVVVTKTLSFLVLPSAPQITTVSAGSSLVQTGYVNELFLPEPISNYELQFGIAADRAVSYELEISSNGQLVDQQLFSEGMGVVAGLGLGAYTLKVTALNSIGSDTKTYNLDIQALQGLDGTGMDIGEIAELPANGRCTAANFGHSNGNTAVTPSASLKTSIINFKATKETGQVTLGFDGVAALYRDNIGQLSGGSEKRVFLLIYRCDDLSTDSTSWDLITPTTGNLSSIKYTAVIDSNDPGYFARTFVDNISENSSVDSKYWYLGFTIVSSSDSPFFFSIIDDPNMLSVAISAFDGATEDSGPTWSDPVVTFADFRPQQSHLTLDLENSANFVNQSGGRYGAVASPRLTDTTIDAYVNHSLTALIEDEDFSGTPDYSWSWNLSLNGSTVATPTGLNFTASENIFMVTGTFGNTDATPGDYMLHATNTASDGSTIYTTTGSLAWLVQARTVKTDVAADSTVVAVEIGNTESFTLTRTWGFADGGASARTDATVNWTISNANASVQFNQTSTSGDSATFSVTFADDENLVGSYTFDVTVAEACNNGAPADCFGLVTSNTISYGVQALGHDFTFSNRSTEIVQGDRSDRAAYVKIWKDSNQASITNFSSYVFQAVNMKSGFTPLTTATMSVVSYSRNGTIASISNGVATAGGVTISADSATASATVTAVLASVTTNDEYVITVQGDSSTSSPTTTSVTIAFIVLEAQAPTVSASAVLDDSTGNAFAWPGTFTSSYFPALVGKDARIRATFSENVAGPQIRVDSGGATGATAAMAGSGTDYTYVVTAAVLQGILGSGDSASFIANFSGSLDQINTVLRNTMADSAATFNIARTPEPDDTLGTSGNEPYPRNSSFIITFADEITGGTVAAIRSGLTLTNILDYHLTVGTDGKSLIISPLAGRELIGTGIISNFTLAAGSVFNEAGFPNTKVGSYTGVTFAADAKAPVLLASTFQANDDFRTDVTYTLTFNEGLSGSAMVTVNNLTAGTSSSFSASPSVNVLTVSTVTLMNDQEYQFQVHVADASSNSVTVDLESFFTLANDAQTQAEIAAANAVDNTAPAVQNIVPDFRQAVNQINVSLWPIISIEFSEQMAQSTTSSVWVSNTLGATSGVALNLEAFDGVTLTVNPSSELMAGTKYWITFGAGAQDVSNNALTPVTYSFTTYDVVEGVADTNTAPEFLGTNMVGALERDAAIRTYFSEPVDVASLESSITIWNGSSAVVSGSWVLDGADATFATTGIVPGGSYTYSIWTSRVADLIGKTDATDEKVNGSFTVKANTAIRDFKVSVEGSGSTLAVTASWTPPVDRANITGYTLTYQALDSNFDPTGSATTLATNSSVNAANIKVNGAISGFSAGSSYQFVVTANGAGTTASVDALSVVDITSRLDNEFVSILSKTSVLVGTISASGDNQGSVNIIQGALDESTEISVSFTLDTNLKNKDGGGDRYSEVVQFGPAGQVFKEPVGIGLRFKPSGGLTSLAASCATLDTTCEADLLSVLSALVFDSHSKTWRKGGLAKTRVEALDANTGVLYARTLALGTFLVAKAFEIASPDSGANLPTATIGQTTYASAISLSGKPSNSTVNVNFSPSTFGFVYALDTVNNEIDITNSAVVRPAGETANSVTVTVTVTDVSDNNQTDTRTYTIPILDLGGDADYAGTPHGVDSFSVSLSNGGATANFVWSIASDTTLRSIDTVVVEYKNLSDSQAQSVIAFYSRGVNSSTVSIVADTRYSWKISTLSAQGVRNFQSTDIERFTFGKAQATATNGAVAALQLGTVLTFAGIGAGEKVFYNGYSNSQLSELAGTGGILLSSSSAATPNGTIEFFQESFIDVSFNGAVASVSYILNQTGDLSVYHYLQTASSGAWEELPDSNTSGQLLWAIIVDNGNGTSTVSINSNGAGSPFFVGPSQ